MDPKAYSYSDISAFQTCPRRYLYWHQRCSCQVSVKQVIGDAVHRIADGKDRTHCIKQAAKRLRGQPPGKMKKALERTVKLADVALAFSRQGPADGKSEHQFTWVDPQIDAALKAKPDRVDLVPDKRGGWALQITDLKSARAFKDKYRHQVLFFGMVVSLANNWNGPVKLVVQLLGSRSVKTFWYYHDLGRKLLAQVRAVIARIRAAWAADDFPAVTGEHCQRCPYRSSCPAYQALPPGDPFG